MPKATGNERKGSFVKGVSEALSFIIEVTSLTAPCCFPQRHQHQGPLETSGLNHTLLFSKDWPG